jgi:hypothetical protein
MVGVESAKNFEKSLWKAKRHSSIKLFRENADVILIAVPSKTTSSGCEMEDYIGP